MTEMEKYKLWLEKATDDLDLKTELESIAGDADAIRDRFYRDLEFGTGGLRGVLGAGTNRMNCYTVGKATQGFADYLLESFEKPSVAIAYDSRIKSDYFADTAASVLAANGIEVYLYDELMPTPMLSYAVRALRCSGGIIITASHNPAKYNGYKAYGDDGCQITLEAAEIILGKIAKVDAFENVKTISLDEAKSKGLVKSVPDSVKEDYYKDVLSQSIHPDVCASSGLKVVFTPLNGAGNKPVRTVLDRIGIKQVVVVPEQEMPDGNFPTCPYPNPEISEALDLGLKLSAKERPDLLLATDPDCDRVGIAVPDGDSYVLFSGNEVGAMLLEYICAERTALGTMPSNPLTVKTIVTTDIVRAIAKKYNVEVVETLTGFKFIGEQIGLLEDKGEENRYIFGFEESYGYLAGSYVRDKDAVVGAMLICEMAAFYRSKGISLIEARNAMYERYGVFLHQQTSFTCEGASGMERMAEIMSDLRENTPSSIGGLKVLSVSDYQTSLQTEVATGTKTELTLPKSNVIAFALEQDASVIIRPSGTEPKIKAYYTAKGESTEVAKQLQDKLSAEFTKILGF